jgi:hypothetical protein
MKSAPSKTSPTLSGIPAPRSAAARVRRADGTTPTRNGHPRAIAGPCPTEAHEQRTLVQWATLAAVEEPRLRLLMMIPNGAARPGTRGALVAQGLRSGVPDLFLATPVPPYGGLWLELKRRSGGRVTPEQREWIARLRAAGYRAEVCRGWEEARHCILDYLAGGGAWQELDLGANPLATSNHC